MGCADAGPGFPQNRATSAATATQVLFCGEAPPPDRLRVALNRFRFSFDAVAAQPTIAARLALPETRQRRSRYAIQRSGSTYPSATSAGPDARRHRARQRLVFRDAARAVDQRLFFVVPLATLRPSRPRRRVCRASRTAARGAAALERRDGARRRNARHGRVEHRGRRRVQNPLFVIVGPGGCRRGSPFRALAPAASSPRL